jgi:hypothetical protein
MVSRLTGAPALYRTPKAASPLDFAMVNNGDAHALDAIFNLV